MKTLRIGVLFTIVTLLTAIITFGQADSTKVESAQPELTKEKVYQDVKEVLTQLGSALKVGSEHVYGVLVLQQVTKGVIWIIIFVVSIILLLISYNQFQKLEFDNYDSIEPKKIVHLVFSIVTGVIGVIIFIAAMFHVDTMVTGIINPEYGAIKEIVNLIR